jgi:methyl-accepting chemotaxis protein
MKAFLLKLTIPNVFTVLCLLALGVNGLLQVGLQRDMAQKAEKLQANLQRTQQLSGEMKDGLHGLSELRDASAHMAGTLSELEQTTAAMSGGLEQLDSIVHGIDGTIGQLGTSTQASGEAVNSTDQHARDLLAILQKIHDVNGDVIQHLDRMIADQRGVNADLADLNAKTQVLPQTGGK